MMKFEVFISPEKHRFLKSHSMIKVYYKTDEKIWGMNQIVEDEELEDERLLYHLKTMKENIRRRVKEHYGTKETPREE